MSPTDEFVTPWLPSSAASNAGNESATERLPETGDGHLDHFPEAVAVGALDAGTPAGRRGSALGFRVVLYAALAIGAVTGLSLVVVWILQAVLTGSYLRAGGDYFGSGLEATAARELLSLPVGGFVVVLLLCLVGMCVGVWGIQRGKKE